MVAKNGEIWQDIFGDEVYRIPHIYRYIYIYISLNDMCAVIS